MVRGELSTGNLKRMVGAGILVFGIAGCNSSDRSELDPERLPVAEIPMEGTPTGEEIYQSILEGLNLNTTPTFDTSTEVITQNQEIPEVIFRAPNPGETPNSCLLPDGTHIILDIFEFNHNGPISSGSCE